MTSPLLSERFSEALVLAAELHRDQVRKGGRVPYLSHLLAVASLVLEDGGDEDQAVAALLHDAVEDQGGAPVLEQIRGRFGATVADIVAGCTDCDVVPKPAWRERKERYVEHLRGASPETRRVSAADKVHNARSLLSDYRQHGDALWGRFNAGRDEILWYYRSLVAVLREHGSPFLVGELERAVAELERISARPAEDVAATILALERAALDRWGRGDPSGFLEISDPEVSYLDPFVARRLDGLEALRAHYEPLRGKVAIDSYELVAPRVEAGTDVAVLTFGFVSRGGNDVHRWNCTEVYRRRPEGWRIAHTHWSIAAPPAGA